MFSNAQTLESAYPLKEDPVPLSKRGYHTNNKYPTIPPLFHLFATQAMFTQTVA